MIKVTFNKPEKKEETPFPKVMISELGQVLYAFCVNPHRDDCLVGVLLKTNGYSIGNNEYSETWGRRLFDDLNEPITIQNA